MHLSRTKSNSLKQPSDSVEETSIADFSRRLKVYFSIFAEPIPERSFGVRFFKGPPSAHSVAESPSMVVYPHAKGTMVSPLVIFSVLRKFDISIEDYLEAVLTDGKLIPIKPNEG